MQVRIHILYNLGGMPVASLPAPHNTVNARQQTQPENVTLLTAIECPLASMHVELAPRRREAVPEPALRLGAR